MLDIDAGYTDQAGVQHDGVSVIGFGGTRFLGTSVTVHHIAEQELTIVRKTAAGWRLSEIETVRTLIADIVSGRVGPCKFLVFDLAMPEGEAQRPGAAFADLVTDLSDLIFQAPVISVAWVRRAAAADDLELALACSILMAEEGAAVTFGSDLTDNLRTYALLAHRIGFVQAERLMDGNLRRSADALQDLLLLQGIVPHSPGFEGITDFVKARTRRHNSACGIYRAQRLAMRGMA